MWRKMLISLWTKVRPTSLCGPSSELTFSIRAVTEEEDAFESDFESTDEEAVQEDVDTAAEKVARDDERRPRKVRAVTCPPALFFVLTQRTDGANSARSRDSSSAQEAPSCLQYRSARGRRAEEEGACRREAQAESSIRCSSERGDRRNHTNGC